MQSGQVLWVVHCTLMRQLTARASERRYKNTVGVWATAATEKREKNLPPIGCPDLVWK